MWYQVVKKVLPAQFRDHRKVSKANPNKIILKIPQKQGLEKKGGTRSGLQACAHSSGHLQSGSLLSVLLSHKEGKVQQLPSADDTAPFTRALYLCS